MQAHTVTAIVGDEQCGSSTALATPHFAIHTGRQEEVQTVQANKAQQWLWECWTDYWEYVKTLCGIRGKYRKHRLVVVNLGEFCDGLHHNTVQVMNELSDQVDMSCEINRPIANLADGGLYVCIGTEAHAGPAGSTDVTVGKEIGAKDIDWEQVLDIDGMVIDCAHHGRVGQRPWTSAAAAMATEVIMDYTAAGEKPPRYVFRAHNHTIDDSGEKIAGTRCICTPSWQLRTAHGRRVAPNRKRSDIGGIILEGDVLNFAKARYSAQPIVKRTIKV